MEEQDARARPALGADRERGGRWWVLSGWGIPRSLDEVRFRDVAVVVVMALTIWGYADVWSHGRIEPGRIDRHKTDVTVYTEAAAAFFDGRDPYHVTSPRGWYYLYPPLFALLIAPLTVLDTEAQVFVWYLLSVVLGFGCYVEARRLWRLLVVAPQIEERRADLGWWVAACLGLAVFLPTLDCLQRGQLGIALVYFLMLGFRLVVQARSWTGWFLGGLILALPAVVKLVPALPVGFLAAQQWSAVVWPGRLGRRPIGKATAVASGIMVGALLFVFVIPSALIGWDKNLVSLRIWAVQVAANEEVGRRSNFDIHSPRNQSLSNAVHLWNTRHAAAAGIPMTKEELRRVERIGRKVVIPLRGVILVSLLVLCLTIGRRRDLLDQAMAFGLACWATILISPLAWGHYYMIELPAILSVPLWLARRGRPTTAKVVVLIPALLAWAHYLKLRYLGPIGFLGFSTTVWFLAVCGTIVLIEGATSIRESRLRSRFKIEPAGLHHLLGDGLATADAGRSQRP